MNSDQEAGIRSAVTAAMSTLSTEDLRELVFEPYRSLRQEVTVAQAA